MALMQKDLPVDLCCEAKKIVERDGDLLIRGREMTELYFHIFNCSTYTLPFSFGITLLGMVIRGETNISLAVV